MNSFLSFLVNKSVLLNRKLLRCNIPEIAYVGALPLSHAHSQINSPCLPYIKTPNTDCLLPLRLTGRAFGLFCFPASLPTPTFDWWGMPPDLMTGIVISLGKHSQQPP